MSMTTNVQNLAVRVATECKAIRTLLNGNAADLAGLNTTAKGNLVLAVNELKAAILALPAPSTVINDAATNSGTTWSSTKISAQVTSAINAVLGGAPAALDTLKELADALANDASFATTFTNFQTAVGDTSTNFVTTFETGLV